MIAHLDLQYLDRVIVKNTGTDLDGTELIVTGVASRNVFDTYIVEFPDGSTQTSIERFGQNPIEYRSFTMIEVCLQRLKNPEVQYVGDAV